MARHGAILARVVAAACVTGCSLADPSLPSVETGTLAPGPATPSGHETTTMVDGTATDAYARVARAALRCWFGADGPLKATHIFHADAASPTQGGAAEIVLHERDGPLRDQRGARAFRITFTTDSGGVRVGITNLKISDALSQLMMRDAEAWANGREGCEARSLGAPRAAPAPSAAKSPSAQRR